MPIRGWSSRTRGGARRRFWAPALALAGAETLGQLVHHRREELGIAAANLRSLTTARGWLGDLEADTARSEARLPAAHSPP